MTERAVFVVVVSLLSAAVALCSSAVVLGCGR